MRIHRLTVDGQNAVRYRKCDEKEPQVIDDRIAIDSTKIAIVLK